MSPAARNGRRLIARADGARDAGRLAEAAILYGEALARLPGDVGVRVQCGHMLKDLGRLEEAERHYRRAWEASPADADLALQLGHLHKLAGRNAQAATFYRRAGELDPAGSEAARELAALSEDGWSGAAQTRTHSQARTTIEGSGLFDPVTYWSLNPDIGPTALSALDHYLMVGARQKRRPHLLFDTAYYLRTYPEVGAAAVNPLDDFVRHGLDKQRNPNPFLDTAWYLAQNPDAVAASLDPVSHYLQVGAPRGADPSPRFDAAFYVANDPDVLSTGLAPLEHYLRFGQKDGRRTSAAERPPGPSRPVTEAAIVCRTPPRLRSEVALFVAHAKAGRLQPHVRRYLEGLAKQDIATVLIVATDAGVQRFDESLDGLVAGLFVRDNRGYDFAAWAHVLALVPALADVDRLYLLNDSLFGPTNDAEFGRMLARARTAPSDLVGVTECYERARHIQSFFLLLNRAVLRSPAFRSFMAAVVAYSDKDDVIDQYECKFSAALQAAGLTAETLFEAGGRNNATIFRWRSLLEAGFPFLKVRTVRDRIEGADATGWRAALEARGYDTRLVDRTLAEAARPEPAAAGCGMTG